MTILSIVLFLCIIIILYKFTSLNKDKVNRYMKTSSTVSDYDKLVDMYCFEVGGKEHWAVIYGNPEKDKFPLVRIQSQCVSEIELDDSECDCKQNLIYSKKMITENKNGGILFLLNQEGRSLGGIEKLIEKNMRVDKSMNMATIIKKRNHVFDLRDYNYLPRCLQLMGFSNNIRLITRFPSRVRDLQKSGINVVEIVEYPYTITADNDKYLQMKKCSFNFDFKEIKCNDYNKKK
jgi:GTP cyclohydrolase II